jgi:hypothetical protein
MPHRLHRFHCSRYAFNPQYPLEVAGKDVHVHLVAPVAPLGCEVVRVPHAVLERHEDMFDGSHGGKLTLTDQSASPPIGISSGRVFCDSNAIVTSVSMVS